MARRAGVHLTLERFDELSRAHAGARQPPPVGQVPDGGFLLRRRPARAAGEPRRPARPRRAHGQRPHARREHRRREDLQRRRDPHARRTRWSPTRRPRGAARQPRARRRGDQAGGGRAAPAQAHRPRGRVRRLRRHGRAHRRRRRSTSTRTPCSCCSNAGPQGAPGMPEWGQLPIPKKLLAAGRARHGAHLRCAHERHELRRLRAARGAGVATSAARSRWCATAT